MNELDEVDMLAFEDAGKEMTNPSQWFHWRRNTRRTEDRHWVFDCDGMSFDNARLSK